VVSRSTGLVITHRGYVAPEWLAPRGAADRYHLISNGYVVALVESAEFDFGVYAAIPTPPVSEQLRETAIVFVPIGAVVASVLVLLVVVIARAQFSMAAALQLALKRNEFVMEYQPIVDLQTRRWVGAEALIRWRREGGRPVRPDVLIQVAQDVGMIQALTARVFQLVIRDMTRFARSHAPRPFHVAVNVSAADLQSDRTVGLVRELLDAVSGSGLSVIVEATEHGLLDQESCRGIIDAIRGSGAAIALDDFGTGYSSLSYIRKFDLDYLKIDRAFIETIGTDSPTSGVVRHIIEIANTMQLQVVAEGVETEVQAAYLAEHGVRLAQGWLFARSMTADALLAALDGVVEPLDPGSAAA
jgi:sensor c-di-GMP phosphodiesterase-like protein